jgi:hypothetical protein
LEFVQSVFEAARSNERDKKEVKKGTESLVELSRQKGRNAFIRLAELKDYAGITRRGGTGGVWPWLEQEADVVEEQTRPKAYRIRKEFWEVMLQMLEPRPTTKAHSIMELEGLGKEMWEGVDPKEYIDRERESWHG